MPCYPGGFLLLPPQRSEAAVPLLLQKVDAAALRLAGPGAAAETGGLWNTQCHRVASLLVPALQGSTWPPRAAQGWPRDAFSISFFFFFLSVCNDVLSV